MRVVLLPNPVLRRELLLAVRDRRSFLLLLALLIALGAGMLLFWWDFVIHAEGANSAQLGMNIFEWFSLAALSATPFLAALLTAGAVTKEREAKTFDMLATANLSPTGILIGKLGASLGLTFLLFALTAPLFAMVLLLGGVSAGEFGALFAFVALTALSYGCVGMAASAFCPTTMAATLLALTYVAVIDWLPMIVVQAIFVGMRGHSDSLFLVPCPATLQQLIPMGLTFTAGPGRQSVAGAPLLFLVAQALLMMLLTRQGYGRGTLRLRRAGPPIIDDPEVLRRRRDQFPYYLIDPRRRRPPIKDWQNPMTRKDSQTLLVGHKTRIIRAGYAAAVLGVFLGAAYQTGAGAWIFAGTVFLCGAATGALAAVMAVHTERQGPCLDLLKTSGLSPALFLRAKILVPFRFALIMQFILLAAGLYIGSWMTGAPPWKTPGLTLTIMLYAAQGAAFGALWGVLMGLEISRTPPALVAAIFGAALLSWLTFGSGALIPLLHKIVPLTWLAPASRIERAARTLDYAPSLGTMGLASRPSRPAPGGHPGPPVQPRGKENLRTPREMNQPNLLHPRQFVHPVHPVHLVRLIPLLPPARHASPLEFLKHTNLPFTRRRRRSRIFK